MEKKEDRRVTMTKRLLKDALTEMLRKEDIYHVSIRELCERADVNRTTFYKYYGNQFDLLAECHLIAVPDHAEKYVFPLPGHVICLVQMQRYLFSGAFILFFYCLCAVFRMNHPVCGIVLIIE